MTRPELWPRSTERLVLRPPTEADLDAVLAWRHHPDVTRWLLTTHVDAERYRREWLGGVDDPLDHSVVAMAGSVVVGTVSLEVRDGMGQGGESPAVGARRHWATCWILLTMVGDTPRRWSWPPSPSPSATSGCAG